MNAFWGLRELRQSKLPLASVMCHSELEASSETSCCPLRVPMPEARSPPREGAVPVQHGQGVLPPDTVGRLPPPATGGEALPLGFPTASARVQGVGVEIEIASKSTNCGALSISVHFLQ